MRAEFHWAMAEPARAATARCASNWSSWRDSAAIACCATSDSVRMPGSSDALISDDGELGDAVPPTRRPNPDGFFMADIWPAIVPVPAPRSSKALLADETSLVFTTATM